MQSGNAEISTIFDTTGMQFTHVPALDSIASNDTRHDRQVSMDTLQGFPKWLCVCLPSGHCWPGTGTPVCSEHSGLLKPMRRLWIGGCPLFGGKSADLSFCRIPAWCCRAVAPLRGRHAHGRKDNNCAVFILYVAATCAALRMGRSCPQKSPPFRIPPSSSSPLPPSQPQNRSSRG